MRLLDLFCGAGGAAMGYHRAGFDVVGIDRRPQPNYPFAFIQADALTPPADLRAFDLIHASPPCQAYSEATDWRGSRDDHPALIGDVREMLQASGVPYVIENVTGARMALQNPVMLCGSMVGLPIRRHRYFEAPGLPFGLQPPCAHESTDLAFDHGYTAPESEYRDAMGCGWMTVKESREAIPPAYTEYLGKRMRETLEREAA